MQEDRILKKKQQLFSRTFLNLTVFKAILAFYGASSSAAGSPASSASSSSTATGRHIFFPKMLTPQRLDWNPSIEIVNIVRLAEDQRFEMRSNRKK